MMTKKTAKTHLGISFLSSETTMQRCVALYCLELCCTRVNEIIGFDVWEFARNVRFFHESWLKSYILHHKPDIGEKLNVNADKLKGIIDRNQLRKQINDDMLDGDLSRLSQFHNKFAHHQFRQRYTPPINNSRLSS